MRAMARRRRSRGRYVTPARRTGSALLGNPASRRGGRRGRRGGFGPSRRRSRGPLVVGLVALLVLAGGVTAFVLVRARQAADDRRADAAAAFAQAWAKGDLEAMWRLTGGEGRPALAAFKRSYGRAYQAAGVERTSVGKPSALRDGRVTIPVTMRTDIFDTLRGDVALPTVDQDGAGRVVWDPKLRLPGLRAGETPTRQAGRQPARGEVLAAGDRLLADDPTGAGIAGSPPVAGEPATGLERIYDKRLAGRPSATLRYGERVVKRVKATKGKDVHTTIQLGLTAKAVAALGDKQAGAAVIRPSDGSVLALAGLAVSAPQPPGSTFKIVTLAAALTHGTAKLSDSYPVKTATTLSGVRLANASNESCGGSLAVSFAESCNSVFAPIGAEVGAKRLVAMAKRFGFGEQPRVPAAKVSTISPASELKDAIAVGSAAIGQEKDLATPLQMATVGATIENRGVRAKPRVVREAKVVKRRVISRKVASTVTDLMIGVVRGGTGTAAANPGVTVAGKTGTAELTATGTGATNPANTTAWFVAFVPGEDLAVATMVVGGGAGGSSAAPIAKRILQAAR
jgi:penicillin-binding protein A